MRKVLLAFCIAVSLSTSACVSLNAVTVPSPVASIVSSNAPPLWRHGPVVSGARDATFGLYRCPGPAAGALCATVVLCKGKKCVSVPDMLVDSGSNVLVVRERTVASLLTGDTHDSKHLRYGSWDCFEAKCTVATGGFRTITAKTGDIAVKDAPVFVARSITYGGHNADYIENGVLGIGGAMSSFRYSINRDQVFYYGPDALVYLHINGFKGYGEVLDTRLFAHKYPNIHASRMFFGVVDTGSNLKDFGVVGVLYTMLLAVDFELNPAHSHIIGRRDIKDGLVINQTTGCAQITGGQYRHIIVCPPF